MLARQLDQVICVLNLAREQPPNLGIPVLARLDAELGGDVARDAGGDGGVNEDFLSAGGCARGRGDDGVVADEGGADGFDRGDVDALDGYRGGKVAVDSLRVMAVMEKLAARRALVTSVPRLPEALGV